MTMTEKLTLKTLSSELELLRTQVKELEARLESKIAALSATAGSGAPAGNITMQQTGMDAEHRQSLIAQEAYLIAERRGFQEGDPSQDWVEAERIVDYRLMHPDETAQPVARTPKPHIKTATPAKKPVVRKKAAPKLSGTAK